MGIYFSSDIDKKKFDQKIAAMQAQIKQTGKVGKTQTASMSKGVDRVTSSVESLIYAYVSLYAIAKAGTGLVDNNIKLESSLAEVATISQDVIDNFEYFRKLLIDMSTDSDQTAIDLTKALYQIVSASFEAEDALVVLGVAQRAATAGFVDMEKSADGITTVLNAWKIEVAKSTEVSDVFFKTVERGKTTFPELAANIATVAPIAAGAGISFEEIAAAVQTLTKQGVPTSVAITQIRQSIIALNAELGDGWAITKTYQDGIIELNEKAGGSQDELKNMIGRVEGVNAVLNLTGKNAKIAANDLAETQNSLGATARAVEEVAKTAQYQIDNLSNILLAELDGLASRMKKSLVVVIKSINDGLESGNIQQAVESIGKLIKVLGTYKLSSLAVGKGQQFMSAVRLESISKEQAALAGLLTAQQKVELGINSQTVSEKALTVAIIEKLRVQIESFKTEAQKKVIVEQAARNEIIANEKSIANIKIKQISLQKQLATATKAADIERISLIQKKQLNLAEVENLTLAKQQQLKAVVSTAAMQADTAATSANTLSTKVNTLTDKAAAAGKITLSGATRVATTSLKSMTAALLANPLGIIITGLTLAIPLISKFVKEQREMTKFTAELAGSIESEKDAVDDLFESLRKLNPESEIAKGIRKQLVEDYPGILKNYDLENTALGNLKLAQEAVNDEIVKTLVLRKTEEQETKLREGYSEDIEKRSEKFATSLKATGSKGVVQAAFANIVSELQDTELTVQEITDNIAEFLDIEKKMAVKGPVPGYPVSVSTTEKTQYSELLEQVTFIDDVIKEYKGKQADLDKVVLDYRASIIELSKKPDAEGTGETEQERVARIEAARLKAEKARLERIAAIKAEIISLQKFLDTKTNEIGNKLTLKSGIVIEETIAGLREELAGLKIYTPEVEDTFLDDLELIRGHYKDYQKDIKDQDQETTASIRAEYGDRLTEAETYVEYLNSIIGSASKEQKIVIQAELEKAVLEEQLANIFESVEYQKALQKIVLANATFNDQILQTQAEFDAEILLLRQNGFDAQADQAEKKIRKLK